MTLIMTRLWHYDPDCDKTPALWTWSWKHYAIMTLIMTRHRHTLALYHSCCQDAGTINLIMTRLWHCDPHNEKTMALWPQSRQDPGIMTLGILTLNNNNTFHNDSHPNNTQYNDNLHTEISWDSLLNICIVMLSVIILRVNLLNVVATLYWPISHQIFQTIDSQPLRQHEWEHFLGHVLKPTASNIAFTKIKSVACIINIFWRA